MKTQKLDKHRYPKFEHHGALSGVTGSCHRYIASPSNHFLIDCGLFQGEEGAGAGGDGSQHEIDFDISQVRGLIVTHVHIDHVGRIPYLLAAGFSGPIYTSMPSARLLPLVLEDALKVGFTRDSRLIERFLAKVGGMLRPLDYGTWLPLVESESCTLRLKLQRAGHILGSAYVELDAKYPDYTHRTVFSGDLGAPYAPLLPAPRSPYRADTLVLESTYGNKQHESRAKRKQRLFAALERAFENGGTVLIPAFSIGRTQELLYELESIISAEQARWGDLEVIVDSPLAAKFTAVYRELKPYWDAEAQRRLRQGRHPLSFDNLYTVGSHEEHLQTVEYLASSTRPTVVIAASGMLNGGRSLNYAKALIENPRHAILFVGYQARGTIGSSIQHYGAKEGGWVMIDGQRYAINAQVLTIGGYSAHADQKNLLNFVKRTRIGPTQIRLIHGEPDAKKILGKNLEEMIKGVEVL